MLCNNYFLRLKIFRFQHPKIILLNLLTYWQVLADLDWQCKMLAENVYLLANGKHQLKKLIEKTSEFIFWLNLWNKKEINTNIMKF